MAERSVLIKNMMEDVGEEAVTEAIPIPNVGPLLLLDMHQWLMDMIRLTRLS